MGLSAPKNLSGFSETPDLTGLLDPSVPPCLTGPVDLPGLPALSGLRSLTGLGGGAPPPQRPSDFPDKHY